MKILLYLAVLNSIFWVMYFIMQLTNPWMFVVPVFVLLLFRIIFGAMLPVTHFPVLRGLWRRCIVTLGCWLLVYTIVPFYSFLQYRGRCSVVAIFTGFLAGATVFFLYFVFLKETKLEMFMYCKDVRHMFKGSANQNRYFSYRQSFPKPPFFQFLWSVSFNIVYLIFAHFSL